MFKWSHILLFFCVIKIISSDESIMYKKLGYRMSIYQIYGFLDKIVETFNLIINRIPKTDLTKIHDLDLFQYPNSREHFKKIPLKICKYFEIITVSNVECSKFQRTTASTTTTTTIMPTIFSYKITPDQYLNQIETTTQQISDTSSITPNDLTIETVTSSPYGESYKTETNEMKLDLSTSILESTTINYRDKETTNMDTTKETDGSILNTEGLTAETTNFYHTTETERYSSNTEGLTSETKNFDTTIETEWTTSNTERLTSETTTTKTEWPTSNTEGLTSETTNVDITAETEWPTSNTEGLTTETEWPTSNTGLTSETTNIDTTTETDWPNSNNEGLTSETTNVDTTQETDWLTLNTEELTSETTNFDIKTETDWPYSNTEGLISKTTLSNNEHTTLTTNIDTGSTTVFPNSVETSTLDATSITETTRSPGTEKCPEDKNGLTIGTTMSTATDTSHSTDIVVTESVGWNEESTTYLSSLYTDIFTSDLTNSVSTTINNTETFITEFPEISTTELDKNSIVDSSTISAATYTVSDIMLTDSSVLGTQSSTVFNGMFSTTLTPGIDMESTTLFGETSDMSDILLHERRKRSNSKNVPKLKKKPITDETIYLVRIANDLIYKYNCSMPELNLVKNALDAITIILNDDTFPVLKLQKKKAKELAMEIQKFKPKYELALNNVLRKISGYVPLIKKTKNIKTIRDLKNFVKLIIIVPKLIIYSLVGEEAKGM